MVERIEVGYSEAAVVGDAGIYHKYILYHCCPINFHENRNVV